MHMTSSKTKHELCTFLKSNGVITVSQVGAPLPPSLSVCVCLFIIYLFMHCPIWFVCPSSYHPTSSTLWSAWRGGLSFDFPSWRFQFSFLCQTRYANIGRAPTATAMQTFGAVTVTITITVIRCCSVAIAATVTVTGRKCNSTSLHASPHSVQSVPSPGQARPGQSSLFHSIPFHSVSFHVSLLPVLAHTSRRRGMPVTCLDKAEHTTRESERGRVKEGEGADNINYIRACHMPPANCHCHLPPATLVGPVHLHLLHKFVPLSFWQSVGRGKDSMHVHACPCMSKHVQVSHSLRSIMLATIDEEEEEERGWSNWTYSVFIRMGNIFNQLQNDASITRT